jgi:hypothetical protein
VPLMDDSSPVGVQACCAIDLISTPTVVPRLRSQLASSRLDQRVIPSSSGGRISVTVKVSSRGEPVAPQHHGGLRAPTRSAIGMPAGHVVKELTVSEMLGKGLLW